MKRLLLDSHIFLWWELDSKRLKQSTVETIRRSLVYISAATTWELEIKRAAGKLHFEGSLPEMLRRSNFLELPVTVAHGVQAAGLPKLHKDPFDRMLVAQAMMEGLTLVTADRQLERYGVELMV